ncbi:aminoglycoside 6'-N-acetyltransferase I [Sanguibacter gelidistatuariae]|uniref:Aminoglycoside 6'-N-acetyltransferase I n=2 Tax=Sanguibacter gelidistatuariae TaxID=1814289 RepID=A0A1G6JGT3_9MICO|nr:aminoglycoside 6'-N-acetyltransferase I [Sanguibacter gelidistatuariae]
MVRTRPLDADSGVDQVARAISDDHRAVVVAVVGPRIVGWGKTHLFADADGVAPAGHYLAGITVDPEFRRLGAGAALTQARISWVGERSASVYYFTNRRNTASIALHQRWGFREIARGPSFHAVPFDGGAGLLMQADLGPSATRHISP